MWEMTTASQKTISKRWLTTTLINGVMWIMQVVHWERDYTWLKERLKGWLLTWYPTSKRASPTVLTKTRASHPHYSKGSPLSYHTRLANTITAAIPGVDTKKTLKATSTEVFQEARTWRAKIYVQPWKKLFDHFFLMTPWKSWPQRAHHREMKV